MANKGIKLDIKWINQINTNLVAVTKQANKIISSRTLEGDHHAAWILKALTCIDLTTLSGDDTQSNVARLCLKASNPLPDDLVKMLDLNSDKYSFTTSSVCVYPLKVESGVRALQKLGVYDKINVASVAAGFPSGQTSLKVRLEEIKYAIENGAKEIDIVIDRALVLREEWDKLYDEIQQMKTACGPNVHMKTILATGELSNLNNIYKASLVAMMAGSDFIKTSTGKESVNATIPFGIVMCRAISDYHERTGYKVGLKPAGGLKTCQDAVNWLIMVKELLGDEWLSPKLFRFGASGLLGNIEQTLYKYATGNMSVSYEFAL